MSHKQEKNKRIRNKTHTHTKKNSNEEQEYKSKSEQQLCGSRRTTHDGMRREAEQPALITHTGGEKEIWWWERGSSKREGVLFRDAMYL